MPRRFPALACALLLAAPAARAQDAPVFIPVGQPLCGGALVVDSFHNAIRSDGRRATVDYLMQIRNATAQPQAFAVTFTYGGGTNQLRRSAQRLAGGQSVTLRLGQESFGNPSGNGALSAWHDLPGYVRIACG